MFEWYKNYSYTRNKIEEKNHTVLKEIKTTWPPPKHNIVLFGIISTSRWKFEIN